MCCTQLAENTGRKKKSPSAHHRTTLPGYMLATKAHIDNLEKMLSSNISSTCLVNMVNFGPLAAEIHSVVWGTPANFNRFCIMASLLQRRRSPEANQTLHDLWSSPRLVHYIHFWGLLPLMEFCYVQNALCVHVLCSGILAALLHGTLAAGLSQTLQR